MRSKVQRSRGVALITAMLVVSLATLLAVQLYDRQYLATRRTTNLVAAEQAWEYALSLEDWARQVLRRDAALGAVDNLTEAWAVQRPPIPIVGGSLESRMIDLQGRYNLNNLAKRDANQVAYFQRLLRVLGLDPELVWPVTDWLDEDMEAAPEGAEDPYYLRMDPPYRSANRLMVNADELRLVRGFDAKAYAAVSPYVTALPEVTAINVNTAPGPVLMALADGLSPSWAQQILARQIAGGFATTEEFLRELPSQGDAQGSAASAMGSLITISSAYFVLLSRITLGRVQSVQYSVIHRTADKISISQRTKGYPDVSATPPAPTRS